MYRKSYSKDPKWITAKFNSDCSMCGTSINKDDYIFWFPLCKSVFCENCGIKESNDFQASKQDEDLLNSQFIH